MTDEPTSPQKSHDDPLVAARNEKHRQVVASGGYPSRFDRTDLASALHDRYADLDPGAETGVEATVAGRLMNVRDMGKLAFGVLQDASGRIQLFVSASVLGVEDFEGFLDLDAGDWIGASGEMRSTSPVTRRLLARTTSWSTRRRCTSLPRRTKHSTATTRRSPRAWTSA